jgi:hypothetical protein
MVTLYFWMYGPQRERPRPMCANWVGAVDGNATDIQRHVALRSSAAALSSDSSRSQPSAAGGISISCRRSGRYSGVFAPNPDICRRDANSATTRERRRYMAPGGGRARCEAKLIPIAAVRGRGRMAPRGAPFLAML